MPEALYGPNAGLTEMLIPAGYVRQAYDPVLRLTAEGTLYETLHSEVATALDAPELPFSLVFRGELGREDLLLEIASSYEAAAGAAGGVWEGGGASLNAGLDDRSD